MLLVIVFKKYIYVENLTLGYKISVKNNFEFREFLYNIFEIGFINTLCWKFLIVMQHQRPITCGKYIPHTFTEAKEKQQ